MRARPARRRSALLALAVAALLALSVSTAAFAQIEGGGEPGAEPTEALEGDAGEGTEGEPDLTGGLEGGAEDQESAEDGTADDGGVDDGTGGGFEEGVADDGFDQGATGFEDQVDDPAAGVDAGGQVDMPEGGVEAGFGGLAEEGNGLLTALFSTSMGLIFVVAGVVWWRQVSAQA
jgi:hypothetical protein